MKIFCCLLLFTIQACHPSKKQQVSDADIVVENNHVTDSLPECLQSMVKTYLSEPMLYPPRKIYSYRYNNNLVYFVTPPCCDFFSELYDSSCVLIANPDGGITGKGDGRAPDFFNSRTDEKLLWMDTRK